MGYFESARIDYFKVFQCIPEIMGMPFVLKGKRWYAARYMDGKFCNRPDKLMVRLVDQDGIQIIEQGGPFMSLWAWMMEYGGCSSKMEAKEKLLAITPARIIVSDAIEEKLDFKYVSRGFMERSYEQRLQIKDPLSLYMHQAFGSINAEYVLKLYNVGCERRNFISKDGVKVSDILTTYWYVNKEDKVCHDKLIRYHANGKRDHAYGGSRHMKTAKGYGFRCLYGEHTLKHRQPGEKVYVVESEKAALFAKAYFGKGIWLASGGKQCLRKKNVQDDWVILPDVDAYPEWKALFGDQCIAWWEWFKDYEPGPKDDLADYIIHAINKKIDGATEKPV